MKERVKNINIEIEKNRLEKLLKRLRVMAIEGEKMRQKEKLK